jgi:hypothetical protein
MNLILKLSKFIASHDWLWYTLDRSILRFSRLLERDRAPIVRNREIKRLAALVSPELKVQGGPFKGMIYPGVDSVCSTILPKLVGCYERELEEPLQRLSKIDYCKIVDIGCAEGYYAVGLAIRYPGARVIAYDVDERARSLCGRMAKLNHVEDRIEIRTACDAKDLHTVIGNEKALIISDCEGFEFDLFTPNLIKALSNCDLVIELHEMLRDANVDEFCDRFHGTHHLERVASIEDCRKAKAYGISILSSFSLKEKELLVAEQRPWGMTWLVARSMK